LISPYEVLSVSMGANDEEIRKRYLNLVKLHSPDKDPEKFKHITDAYEKIKDEDSRLNYLIYNKDVDAKSPFGAFCKFARLHQGRKPLKYDKMKEFFRGCLKK